MNAFPVPEQAPLQNISFLFPRVNEVSILRLDEIDPVISGNKWYKLRYYLQDASEQNCSVIVTMGGPWSNHLVATAAASAKLGFRCIGLVRGEEPRQHSATLIQARQWGMELAFLNRKDYDRQMIPASFQLPGYYFIPAGGYGMKGALGAAAILDNIQEEYDYICCATGTGTTLAGLVIASASKQHIIGISALKDHPELEAGITALTGSERQNWQLIRDFHAGGYARYHNELITFMNNFHKMTGIPSDFVYTGKLFYGIHSLVEHGYFPQAARLLLIHSGGLQGNASLGAGILAF